jgi:hypothetical protein
MVLYNLKKANKLNTQMNKFILFLNLLLFFSTYAKGQAPIDNRDWIVGRYWCVVNQTNSSFGVMSTGYGWIDFEKNVNNDSTFIITDSCQMGSGGAGWWQYWVEVQADSSLIYTGACGWFCSNGQLFSNDSLYYQCKVTSTSYHAVYNGFKVWSYVGMKEVLQNEAFISTYPNPSTNEIRLQCFQRSFVNKQPIVYDPLGRVVFLNFVLINSKTWFANVQDLPAGIYYLTLLTDKGYVKEKIIVQH